MKQKNKMMKRNETERARPKKREEKSESEKRNVTHNEKKESGEP